MVVLPHTCKWFDLKTAVRNGHPNWGAHGPPAKTREPPANRIDAVRKSVRRKVDFFAITDNSIG